MSKRKNKKSKANSKLKKPSDSKFKRTTPFKLNQWSEDRMKMALEACHSGECSINQAARIWQVPRATLQLRYKGIVKGFQHASGRKPVIPSEAEEELTRLLCDLASRGFPLSAKMVRDVAFQFANKHGIADFSAKKGTAGYDWMHGFMRRHPNLSMKKPEALSAAHASGVNRPVIEAWFAHLSEFLMSLGIKDRPTNLWNVDETGVQDFFVPK